MTPVHRPEQIDIRAFLVLFFLVTFGLPVPLARAAAIPSDLKEIHVLNRLAFGPSAGDIEHIRSIGVEKYIQEQLSPGSISLPQNLADELNNLDTLRLSAPELFIEYGPPSYRGMQGDKEAVLKARQRARVIVEQAIQARLRRAIESPRQLEEVMVNFWFNHFNVFAQKGLDHLWIGSYEKEAIRPYALGRFRDLLGATAKHPAMLFYLDNWQNTAPGSPGARGNFKGLNENYARELMELHTLGVDGGYTQQDVITLARILTGWGFRRPGQAVQARAARLVGGQQRENLSASNAFYFDPKRHDSSQKVFLGHSLGGSGISEGEEALDILAEHPSTARHIGFELAQYFVSDTPPKSLVDRLAREYLASRGDIRSVLNNLFHSPEFWDQQYFGKKFKTPYEYVISAVRASGTPATKMRPLYGVMAQLGMPLYHCQTPDGFKNTQEAWLNPNAMTQRINFATALAAGRLPLKQSPGNAMEQMGEAKMASVESKSMPVEPADSASLIKVIGPMLSQETKAVIEKSRPEFRAPLILGSAGFMHR
ncbi:MAG: DUF1800 domain-containing protein [Alphaproteobacteria bacterium]